ncbi:MAG: hypothetical protein LBS71_03245 [Puniceicoccales bacterium]|jgi:hypothetical protein|nr:hypothetical protein [Puniceicoccales bacterium]
MKIDKIVGICILGVTSPLFGNYDYDAGEEWLKKARANMRANPVARNWGERHVAAYVNTNYNNAPVPNQSPPQANYYSAPAIPSQPPSPWYQPSNYTPQSQPPQASYYNAPAPEHNVAWKKAATPSNDIIIGVANKTPIRKNIFEQLSPTDQKNLSNLMNGIIAQSAERLAAQLNSLQAYRNKEKSMGY